MAAAEGLVLVDLVGLRRDTVDWEYTRLLLDAPTITYVYEEARLEELARCLDGYGVSIITGPWGRDFWGLVSPEVKVYVQPDGYEFTERYTRWEWAVVNSGGSLADAHGLAEKPAVRGGRLALANAARGMVDSLCATPEQDSYHISQFPVETLTEEEFCEKLKAWTEEGTLVALDYEWRIPSRELLAVSVADAGHTYFVPVRASGEVIRDAVGRAILEGLPSVWHNARADIGTQHVDPMRFWGKDINDTLICAYLCGLTGDLGLKELTRQHLGRDPVAFPGGAEYEAWPEDRQARYAGMDARNTYDLFRLLYGWMVEKGVNGVYEELEKPLIPMVASMEQEGSPLDMEKVVRLKGLWGRHEERLRRLFLPEYDISKPEDIRALVRNQSGFDPGSVAKPILSKVQARYMDAVLRYRQAHTTGNNFLGNKVKSWEEKGRPVDFRFHAKFNQAGNTADGESFKSAPRTGRFSSSGEKKEGQLQNQPRAIRAAFVPPPGDYLYFSFDYSGLELMIAAGLSQDPEMMRVLTAVCPAPPCTHKPKCGDLHAAFQMRIHELTSVLVDRVVAKQGNFLLLYEGAADRLITTLAMQRAYIDYPTAEAIVHTHHEVHRRYHEWGLEMIDMARAKGYSETLDGRRRWIPELYSSDPRVQGNGERAAINTPVQGTAADKLKWLMRESVPLLVEYGAHIATQVHDEVTGWVEAEWAKEFKEDMIGLGSSIEINGLRLRLEGGVGPNWKDAKP